MIVIVIYIMFILIYGLIKKVNAYDAFMRGVENNFKTVLNIFPTILIIIVAINVFINSGIIDIIKTLIPKNLLVPELYLQAMLRPISSSSAMIMMIKIFETYGVNSISGKISSIIQGCNDTTIYVIALYFGSIKMKNVGKALKIGLLNDLLTYIFVFIFCYFFFKNFG